MMGEDSRPSTTTILIFLFTDLEGSTRLWQQYPEEMKVVLARHDEIVRTAVENANGQVVKTTGDGFHAAFDSAQDGLRACIAAQRSLRAENWAISAPLRVRMGLHAGEAQQRAGDYYGTAVNRAARLMSAANGGQVLLSGAIVALVADHLPQDVSLRDLGEHRLKDLQQPEHIYQLLHPELLDDFPAIASLTQMPNNLPLQPSLFIGRERELREINQRLISDQVRLLTLLGPGGTGKTRLALQSGAEVIERFADGTYFVDLAPARDPNSALTLIARTIGLRESSNGSMLNDLTSQLREKHMLLLLDNFEQVTEAAVQIAALLQHCPRLKLLATSREALRVRGEHLYPVPPLGLPDIDHRHPSVEELAGSEAVQLFIARAQAVKPNFELTAENAEAIAELCLRLDGLPLAIELATARLRLFSPEALRQRLGNRLKLLRGGARDLPERQQTLRDTIDWSYELLTGGEKRLFEVVSVFAGGTFEAVEAVTGAIDPLADSDIDVIDGLSSLVDKSLLRLIDDGDAEPQLQMLETIREYAADRLQADPDLHQATCLAHATYYADFARQQWRNAAYDRDAALGEMAAAVENLKIAWDYWSSAGDLDQLHKMVDALWLLYDRRGWYQDTVKLTTDLLTLLSSGSTSAEQARQEIMLQTSLARALQTLKGFTPEVEEAFTRALRLSEKQGEIPQMFPVLRGLASYYMFRTDFAKAAVLGEKILALAESEDDDLMRLHGYLVYGINHGFQVSLPRALEILEQGVALFDPNRHRLQPFQIGNNPGIVCHTASAIMLYWLGYADRALSRADRAILLARQLDHPYTMTYAWFHTGLLHMWMHHWQRAEAHALAMREIAVENDYQLWNALSMILQGAAQTALGQIDEGIGRLERGIKAYLGHNSPPVFWPDLVALRATAYGQAGQTAAGLRLINELLQQVGVEHVASISPTLGLVQGELLAQESPEQAAELLRMMVGGAQAVGAVLIALKAVTRLCQLELQAGQGAASGPLLSAIYAGFTEGFETADLLEARAVLDQWQAHTTA